jgi:hypothetical protein
MSRTLAGLLITLVFFTLNCGRGTVTNKAENSNQQKDTGTAVITFTEYEHNFGKVAEGEKIGYTFTFKNKGTGNLVISSATTTCGCTVPKYNIKPIPSGGTGNIEVVFDTSGRNGMQTKTITVKSNASAPVVLLKITAEVLTKNN